jgi:crotonobetainyl-CoA:carnitine CoA-transferase CaiB-like acyl-CoA transferase
VARRASARGSQGGLQLSNREAERSRAETGSVEAVIGNSSGLIGRTVRELALLLRVSDTPAVAHRLAPGRGEHTGELLAWAGYGAGQIAELRSRHVIS